MGIIKLGIYDEHKISREGLSIILREIRDFEVLFEVGNSSELANALKIAHVNVLLINLHFVNAAFLSMLSQINIEQSNIKTLVLSAHDKEEVVLKIIKTGAKGFLAKETGRKELVEAIHTLRNGHDYYSQSITHLLLQQYISKIQNEQSNEYINLKNLSSREIEIIELWGNSYTNQEIADKLFISIRTVESHKNHIMQKLNLKTAVDLVKFAIKNNIIKI